MIKLKKLLKEIFIDNQGNLIEDADFAVVQTDFFDFNIIDIEKIDLSNKIYFKTSYANWDEKRIAKELYNQILALYRGTSMEKWNKENPHQPGMSNNHLATSFPTPLYKILDSSGFDSSALQIILRNGKAQYKNNNEGERKIVGWEYKPFILELPIAQENYQLDMGLTFNKGLFGGGEKTTIGPGDKAKTTSTKDDIEFKLENSNIVFIPVIFEGLNKIPNDKSSIISIIQDRGLESY